MLRQRLLYGAIMIGVLVGLIWLDDRLARTPDAVGFGQRYDGLVVTIIMAILVVAGSRELTALLKASGARPAEAAAGLFAVLLTVTPFLAGNDLLRRTGLGADAATVAAVAIGLFTTFVVIAARRDSEGAIRDLGATLLTIVYLGLLAQYLVRIRFDLAARSAWVLLYVVGTVKVCDIGAYFTGRAVGRTKLIAWLSPGKTVEGLLGGVAASVAVATFVPLALTGHVSPRLQEAFPSPPAAAAFGVLMALAGQAGDLFESLLKRAARAKDSAAVVPAFGGVLDILDSLLFAAPVAYWFMLQ